MLEKFVKNRKGLDYYPPLVAIIGIFVLGAIISMVFLKQYPLAAQFSLGREPLRLFHTYATADKALAFVDESASIALERSAYISGKSGFYDSTPSCGSRDGLNLWSIGSMESDCTFPLTTCYPGESGAASQFKSNFESALGELVKTFNAKGPVIVNGKPVVRPDSYNLKLQPVPGRTEITGTADKPLVIAYGVTNPLKYEVKAGFRVDLPFDLLTNRKAIVDTAQQAAGKLENDARDVINSADGVGGLDWKEDFNLERIGSICLHDVGTCSCCQDEQECNKFDKDGFCVEWGDWVTVPAGDGTVVEKLPFDIITAPMSVKVDGAGGSHARFFIYDDASGKVSGRDMTYEFPLTWMDPPPKEPQPACECSFGSQC